MELGKMNTMRVVKQVDFGLYLDGGDEGEILLPARYVPEGCRPGDELRVFIYLDNEERLVATTETPLAQVGDFACLEVAWTNQYGAFLKWGPMKDLFVPFREQKVRMEVGRRYVVHVHVDEESFRIMASAKVEHFLDKGMPDYEAGQEVDLLVWQKTDLGYKAIVDNRYAGLLYEQEVFRPLRPGEHVRGFIRQVRPDGKIDLTLRRDGQEGVHDFAGTLLRRLKDNGGSLPLHDKSPADEVYALLGVSKKVFKKAVGELYKKRLVVLEPDRIRLAA